MTTEPITLDATELEDLVAEQLPALAEAAQRIAGAARSLLDFIPPELNPVVVTRDRITELADSAEHLLGIVKTPTLRVSTADVDRPAA